ncbi:hypothetical protein [Dysgonomonas massiliensis]|uniref:hypothetical protein n=1 Tax=Dysgonomonas massiliensis TaxID=2040292 RepID=UPI000C777AC9|nr:hypothetical protein [Dysgonomonas massiliensis]
MITTYEQAKRLKELGRIRKTLSKAEVLANKSHDTAQDVLFILDSICETNDFSEKCSVDICSGNDSMITHNESERSLSLDDDTIKEIIKLYQSGESLEDIFS